MVEHRMLWYILSRWTEPLFDKNILNTCVSKKKTKLLIKTRSLLHRNQLTTYVESRGCVILFYGVDNQLGCESIYSIAQFGGNLNSSRSE